MEYKYMEREYNGSYHEVLIHGEGIELVLSWSINTWRGNKTVLIVEFRYMERE